MMDCQRSSCVYRDSRAASHFLRNTAWLALKTRMNRPSSPVVEPCSSWTRVTSPQSSVLNPAAFARRQ